MQVYDFFTAKGFLIDEDQDGLADGTAGRIGVSHDLHPAGRLFALNLLARLSYESAAMPIDILQFGCIGTAVQIYNHPDNGLSSMDMQADGSVCFAIGAQSPWEYFCMRFPYLWDVGPEQATLQALCAALGGTLRSVTVKRGTVGLWEVQVQAEPKPDVEIQALLSQYPRLWRLVLCMDMGRTAYENAAFTQEEALPVVENETKAEKPVDILDLFSLRGVYEDPIGDLMHNTCSFCVAIEEQMDETAFCAAGNIVTRLQTDCLSLSAMPVVFAGTQGDRPCIFLRNSAAAYARLAAEGRDVVLEGGSEQLLAFSRYLATEYPVVNPALDRTLEDVLDFLQNAARAHNGIGQLTCLLAEQDGIEQAERIYLSDLSGIDLRNANEQMPDCPPLYSCKGERVIYRQEADLPWEADVFVQYAGQALRGLSPGQRVRVLGCLGQDAQVRRETADRIKQLTETLGLQLEEVRINCSYKQAFFWIQEQVIGELQRRGMDKLVDSIQIEFAPFYYEGIEDWSLYPGPVPDMDIGDAKWKDLPIRFLQEIYPIDDVLSEALNISREKISFHMTKIKEHYRLTCLDKAGQTLYQDTFSMQMHTRQYLDRFPHLGTVLLNTGGITVWAEGRLVMSQRVKTDTEAVWDYVQEHLFAPAGEYVSTLPPDTALPIFKNVQVCCDICGVDYPLPYRTDIVSALEALQEDIHFVGLEYFKHLGKALWGKEIGEPGMILPFIRKKACGGPHVSVQLSVENQSLPAIQAGGVTREIRGKDVAFSSVELRFTEAKAVLCLQAAGSDAHSWMKAFHMLSETGVIKTEFGTPGLSIQTPQGAIFYIPGKSAAPDKKAELDLGLLPFDRLAGYEAYRKAMEHLHTAGPFSVYELERSYQGRIIYAVECVKPVSGRVTSRMKRINAKPVFLLNCRHHANEVSSTCMAFDLLRLFITDSNYEKYWKGVNIVLIPFANVDGGAVHERMQQDNPQWMLHAARFNSVGVDFRSLYFTDTKYTEANAVPKLWRKWLPDIVADNHGIPTHECNFPAMGFQRPELKEHWIPRSLFFGYLWHVKDAKGVGNEAVNKMIKTRVADAINQDSEIVARNADWKDRYHKYANQWMPRLFGADYYKDVIFYERQQFPDKDAKQVSLRYPHITAMDWVTEVADETATGEYLQLCARTHKTAALATMDSLLQDMPQQLDNLDCMQAQGVFLCRKRRRPLQVGIKPELHCR